ncbi:hypothetical protein L195_g054244, partial [Trifolium pratense]
MGKTVKGRKKASLWRQRCDHVEVRYKRYIFELDDFCDDGVEHMEEEECPAMGAEIGNNRT